MEKRTSASGLNRMRLFFLSAERQGPRIISVLHDTVSHSVGNTGQNTSYILGEMDKQQKLDPNFQLPKDLKISAIDRFSANCEEWLDFIVPGTRIQYGVDMERNFTTLMVKNQGEFHLPVATGFGITYVLPVIIALLTSKSGDLLLLENPEAHIHPAGQRWLGELIALACAGGVQIMVETHSDHVINGIRLAVKKNKIHPESTGIFFFYKDEKEDYKHKVILPTIDRDGRIDIWPEGFLDEGDNALLDLL